ncbi:MAG: hypothetical protein C4345_11360, partial [Chloroflexota bacterium]
TQSLTLLNGPAVTITVPEPFPAEIEAEVQVLRFGDFWIVALPGEVFVETGGRIAATMPGGGERTLVTSYSNGAAGYVP